MPDINMKYDKDEIELMDVFFILWKKRIFIISGTLVCMIFAAAYSFSLPNIKTYQMQMKIRPGYVNPGSGYQEVLLYIKGKIDANIYDEEIIRTLPASSLKQISDDIDFKVSIPHNSDILDIFLDVSDVELGKKILQNLYLLLLKEDNIKMEEIINGYDQEIRLGKIKLDENSALVKSKLSDLEIIDQRIAALNTMAADTKANNEILTAEQKNFLVLHGKKDENLVAALFYNNILQEGLLLFNNLMNEINETLQKRQTIKKEKDLLEIERNEINEAILKIENLKSQTSKMVMLLPPKHSEYPIKPKKKIIIMSAGAAGFFLMVMLTFLLQYVSSYQKRQKPGQV